MNEHTSFFSPTKEKIYITASFVGLRFLLGYLNRLGVQAKAPFFVNMFIAAIDFVVSLPMKLIFGSEFLKGILRGKIGVLVFFISILAYWYLFACVLFYAYELLNKKDVEEKLKQKPQEENKAAE